MSACLDATLSPKLSRNPRAFLVTPNRQEAQRLSGCQITDVASMEKAAAKKFVTAAIQSNPGLGKGIGPVLGDLDTFAGKVKL